MFVVYHGIEKEDSNLLLTVHTKRLYLLHRTILLFCRKFCSNIFRRALWEFWQVLGFVGYCTD